MFGSKKTKTKPKPQKRPQPCYNCNGTGLETVSLPGGGVTSRTCRTCNATGRR